MIFSVETIGFVAILLLSANSLTSGRYISEINTFLITFGILITLVYLPLIINMSFEFNHNSHQRLQFYLVLFIVMVIASYSHEIGLSIISSAYLWITGETLTNLIIKKIYTKELL